MMPSIGRSQPTLQIRNQSDLLNSLRFEPIPCECLPPIQNLLKSVTAAVEKSLTPTWEERIPRKHHGGGITVVQQRAYRQWFVSNVDAHVYTCCVGCIKGEINITLHNFDNGEEIECFTKLYDKGMMVGNMIFKDRVGF